MQNDKLDIIRDTLRRVRRAIYAAESARRLLAVLLVVATVAIVALALQRGLYSLLPPGLRYLNLLTPLAVAGAIAALPVALLHRVTLDDAARYADECGQCRQKIQTAAELLRSRPASPPPPADGRKEADFSPMAALVVSQAAQCCRELRQGAIQYHNFRTYNRLRLLAVATVALAALLLTPPWRTAEIRRQERQRESAIVALDQAAEQLAALSAANSADAAQLAATGEALERLRQALQHRLDDRNVSQAVKELSDQLNALAARRQARHSLSSMTRESGDTGEPGESSAGSAADGDRSAEGVDAQAVAADEQLDHALALARQAQLRADHLTAASAALDEHGTSPLSSSHDNDGASVNSAADQGSATERAKRIADVTAEWNRRYENAPAAAGAENDDSAEVARVPATPATPAVPATPPAPEAVEAINRQAERVYVDSLPLDLQQTVKAYFERQ